jgi:phage terminase large subunit-like protein
MSHQQDVTQYCKDILSGKILSGIYAKKSVKRFVDDLKRQKEDSFLYEYVPALADEVMDFAESLIIPDIMREDGTKNLILLPWMKFIYANIWGWRHKSDNTVRRFRSGYVEVARKNSKTTSILFPFILWDFIETDSAEAYFVSGDQLQSTKSFKELSFIIKADKTLSKHVSETVYAMTLNHSRVAFFSSESNSIDSYKNSLSIIDEFHQYQSDRIVTAFKYGGRARKNCLTLIITSAGTNISGPCYQENLRIKKILNGAFDDENHFGIIYSYDDEDDWKDLKLLIKANPSLGTFLKPEIIENDLNDALTMPSHAPDYKAKTCGIWTAAGSCWLNIQKWQKNADYKIDESILLGRECCLAMDLSSVSDFSALTMYFKLSDGKYYAKHKFYIPSETLYEKYKKENINILQWVQDGLVTAIDGPTINQEVIYQDIVELSKRYNVRELNYDSWNASIITDKIIANTNIAVIPYEQGIKKMGPATKLFETQVLNGLVVDNNPVTNWMMGNVVIKINANGFYKPLKPYGSSPDKIDGVITSIMALDRLIANENVAPPAEHTLEEMLASF